MRYKKGDYVVIADIATPPNWCGKTVQIDSAHTPGVGWEYTVLDGKLPCPMDNFEIERPATEAEILEYKLTM